MAQHDVKQDQSRFKTCSNPACKTTYLTGTGNGNGYCSDPCEDQDQNMSGKTQEQAQNIGEAAKKVIL